MTLTGGDRLLDRDQVDLRALALDPGEAVAQQRRRGHLGEAEQRPERDAVSDLVGRDLERDVLEHGRPR